MNPPKTLFEYIGLPSLIGYRKPTPEERRYAFFNRRLFAFTIDAILMMQLVAPIVDMVFIRIHGMPPIDMTALQAEMHQIADPREATVHLLKTLAETGALQYAFDNLMYQVNTLLVVSGLFWLRWGATPGKMLMRIKVVDAKTEGPLTFLQVLLRAGGYLVSAVFFLMGFFWIGLDKRRQGWHDKLADTVVLARPIWPDLYQAFQLLIGKITGNHQKRGE